MTGIWTSVSPPTLSYRTAFLHDLDQLTGTRIIALVLGLLCTSPAAAENLLEALTRTLAVNPAINAQRAHRHATSEDLPVAQSRYLPRIAASAEGGARYERQVDPFGHVEENLLNPRSFRLDISQNVFDGFHTTNAVVRALSRDRGAIELLKNTEQGTMLEVVQAYIDVISARSLVNLSRSHTAALEHQLRQVRGRHKFGDVTLTDVVQVEARVEGSKAQASLAEAELSAATARYERVAGSLPEGLAAVPAIDALVPASMDEALRIAMRQHPAILAASHGAEAARFETRIVESELLPSVSVNGSIAQNYDIKQRHDEELDAVALLQVKIPIFQGGEVRARVRKAAHVARQLQFEANSIRDKVQSAVITNWGQLQSAKSRMRSAEAQVRFAETTVSGVLGEAGLGARTNVDVLEAEEDLLAAQINLVEAKLDRVFATYAVVTAVGALSFDVLQEFLVDPQPRTVRFAEIRPRCPVAKATPAMRAPAKQETPQQCLDCRWVLSPAPESKNANGDLRNLIRTEITEQETELNLIQLRSSLSE